MRNGKPITEMPIQRAMCPTCPFRPGVPAKYARLAPMIANSAASEATRICHSTGKNNAFHKDTGKPERVCRGARDIQLQLFHRLGFIAAATDAAWEAKCIEMGLKKSKSK